MTEVPFDLVDLSGTIRFRGTAVPPLGGAAVQAAYVGSNVAINNGVTKALPFTTLDAGTDLLDRSTPDAPTFLEAGTYAVAIEAVGDALTAAGFATLTIPVPDVGFNLNTTTEHPDWGWTVSGVFVAQAGDPFAARVTNLDGAVPRTFNIGAALLVKL